MSARMDAVRACIERTLGEYRIGDDLFRAVVAGSIIHDLGLTKVYDAHDDPVCPFDCDRCHDSEECPCDNCERQRR